jgi:hypothetical protein
MTALHATALHATVVHVTVLHTAALTSSAMAGILIGLGIPVAVCAAVAVIVWSYFRLQAEQVLQRLGRLPRRPRAD